MIQSGTAVWFARHESRLAWRDWVAMMTAGKRERRRSVAIGFAAFVVGLHVVAYFAVAGFATAMLDKQMLIGITAMILLSWLLMVSQAMESMTRAFYARADLDLILASPVAAQRLFAVRIGTVALTMAVMALPLAAPFIDMLIWRGGWRWLGAYGVIVAMGAAATAVAVTLTVALFRALGPRRTRLAAQVIAAVIGAAFVIGLQVAAIFLRHAVTRRPAAVEDRAGVGAGCRQRCLVAGARRAWRRAGACRRAGYELHLARGRHRAGVAALRRICDGRIRRRRLAGEPRAAKRRLSRRLAASGAPPQGVAAAAPRSVARLADPDADALSVAAGDHAVEEF